LHQLGQFAQAKSAYEHVLSKQPKHSDALHLLGIVAAQTNNPSLAAELIGKAIEINPNSSQAYFNLGNALQELKRLDEALMNYDKAIALKPDYADAFNNRANTLLSLNRLDEALMSYDKAIAFKPDFANAFINRGNVLKKLNSLDDSLTSYDKALALKPGHPEALYNRGNALQELNRLDDSLTSYDKAITFKPDYADAFNNRGNALKKLNRLDEALASYDKAIAFKPDYADAFNNRGDALQELNRLDDALASYDKALALKPGFPEALYNRGNALQELNRLVDALTSYDKALALKPGYPEALYNRGNALQKLRRLDDSLTSYDKAIAFKPDYAKAYNNRGNALQELKRLDDALASFDKAITLEPDYAKAYNNRGNTLKELKRLDDALASFDKAIAIRPDGADAFNNRGYTLSELKRLDDALVSFDKAIALRPDYKFLRGTKLHTQMRICNWSDLDNQLKELEASVAEEQKVTHPFPLLGLTDRPDLQLKASRVYANEKYPAPGVLDKLKIRAADGKIRIGYYSADFHNHATSILMAELFEAHDAQKFELYGFSFGPDTQDEMRSRVTRGFNHFFDITKKSDREVAQMSRDIAIDIAVDLKGFTQNSRTQIFAERCAPVQINYLGYPGTLAASYFDYIVADKTLIPQESQQYYSEKIIYLPYSYQVNDSKRKISPKVFTRQELGLPESGFVFCCFNNNYKILPATFDVWMRLLKTVKASVLWLFQDNPTAAKNLRKEAEIRGIDPARLVFAPTMKLEEHLARHRVADLFIDTLPYNAHTTASDALWAGLPVLTQIGHSFAARVAASLLNAMDLPELITKTQEEYVSRAVYLANNPLRLAEIKKKLELNRETSPLFNGQLFARHIEAAYEEIHRRQLSGNQPEHIDVETLMG
jgi:predicted O-linked N-acetylglucosamine transferase (SPINDLY family)